MTGHRTDRTERDMRATAQRVLEHLGGLSPATRAAVRGCARGRYQRALLKGHECWSGNSLGGRARQYSASYAESREGLLRRINALPGVSAEIRSIPSADTGRVRHELFVNGLEW